MDIFIRTGRYKSIEAPIEWTDIPNFAVLTGENGAGKTQLLECINGSLNPSTKSPSPFAGMKVEVSDLEIKQSDIVFVPNMSTKMESGNVGLGQSSSQIRQIVDRAAKNQPQTPYERPVLDRLKALGAEKLEIGEVLQHFQPEFFYSNPLSIEGSIARHFVNYEIDYANLRKCDATREEALAKVGAAPWEILNDLLDASGFAYEVTTPRNLDLRDNYRLQCRHRDVDRTVTIDELSSGEAASLRLYFWMYAAEQHYRFPKLVLLDEPDSHLHPTLIKSFIGSLQRGLVEKLECRVVMTTHRSETIAFTSDGALFEMHAEGPSRIRKSVSKHATIFLLTNNLIALLSEETRPVFVETKPMCNFTGRLSKYSKIAASGLIRRNPNS